MRKRTAQSIEEKKAAGITEGSDKKLGRGKHRNPKSLANLKPYPKGKSGNPGGKPGTDVAAKIARAIFEANEKAIYDGMGKRLIAGSAYDFSVLADRAYGKIKDKHEISGPDGDPVALTIRFVKPKLKDMK